MPVSLLVPHLHLLARQALSCVLLLLLLGNTHGKSTAGGLGVGAPTLPGCLLSSRVSHLTPVYMSYTLDLCSGSFTAGLVVEPPLSRALKL